MLNSIAQDLNRPLEEGYIVLIVVAGLLTAFAAIFIIHTLVTKRKRAKEVQRKYERAIQNCGLSPAEIDLLEKLALNLKTPEKKYLLVVNQHVFNMCVREYRMGAALSPELVASLAKKLSFKLYDPVHLPVKSRDLLPGKPAVLAFADGSRISGVIAAQRKDALLFALAQGQTAPPVGSDATLYLHNSLGIHFFPTLVLNTAGSEVALMHSDRISRIQRREYYRKETMLPILIQREGPSEKPLPSVILDLSAGGMRLKNPLHRFRKGDDCRFFFTEEADANFNLYGEVIRTSKAGEILHVRFGHLGASVEDQIIGFLHTRKTSPTA